MTYYLPTGDSIEVAADISKGAPFITYTMPDGKIVSAKRASPPGEAFDFIRAEEERPETRTGGPTRYRPRLGPRKPAGRVW